MIFINNEIKSTKINPDAPFDWPFLKAKTIFDD